MYDTRDWNREMGFKQKDVSSLNQKRGIDEFDNAFLDGIFVEPNQSPPNMRLKDMHKYYKRHNRNPKSLTDEEIKQFRSCRDSIPELAALRLG